MNTDNTTGDYLDYAITDADAYATVVRGANVEISQLEPGPLRGHHLRVGLPGGSISWIATNLPLRGHGRFPPGIWSLTVVTHTASPSLQHGVKVHAGCPFYHRPGAEHDGIYGRDFSMVCIGLREDVFAESLRTEFPELSGLLDAPWRVCEPAGETRHELIALFAQAAAVVRTDERARRSSAAMAVMQDEVLAAFLEALAEGTSTTPTLAQSHAARVVRRAEELAGGPDDRPLRVGDLCSGCGVPRRTLNHAFQQVLGMGPATYLRRLRLNKVRRSLRQLHASGEPISVTEIALDHGFWHTGRFSSQYRELFGESPRQSRLAAGGCAQG